MHRTLTAALGPLAPSPDARLRQLWPLLGRLPGLRFDAPVDQLSHAMQCASRAWRDTGSCQWALAGLFHDIGRLFDAHRHAECSALLLQPLLDAEALWVVAQHDTFMLPYAPAQAPLSPAERQAWQRWRGHSWCARARQFADDWDSRAFDPAYPSLPLDFFAPLLWDHAQARTQHPRANHQRTAQELHHV